MFSGGVHAEEPELQRRVLAVCGGLRRPAVQAEEGPGPPAQPSPRPRLTDRQAHLKQMTNGKTGFIINQ